MKDGTLYLMVFIVAFLTSFLLGLLNEAGIL